MRKSKSEARPTDAINIGVEAGQVESDNPGPQDHTAKDDIAGVASPGDLESPMKLGRKMSTNENSEKVNAAESSSTQK